MLCFGDAHDAKCNADRHWAERQCCRSMTSAEKGAVAWEVLAHEVSIRITARGVVGRWRGWPPASKVSMMIMRPPQQRQGCARGCGGSVWLVGSAADGARFKSLRTASMVSVRLLLASRP